MRYNQPLSIPMLWFKRQPGTRRPALKQLGDLESSLMERIWLLGETSVRHLHAEFAPGLAYTTIMTTLDRLFKKGLLLRRKTGKAYFYAPAVTEREYREHLAQHLFGVALHDGKRGDALLSSFVDVVSEADQQMLDRLDLLVKAKRRARRRLEPEA
jgi:predicted transcriptional regulator